MAELFIVLAILFYLLIGWFSWRITCLNKEYVGAVAMVAHNSWIGTALFITLTLLWPFSHLIVLIVTTIAGKMEK